MISTCRVSESRKSQPGRWGESQLAALSSLSEGSVHSVLHQPWEARERAGRLSCTVSKWEKAFKSRENTFIQPIRQIALKGKHISWLKPASMQYFPISSKNSHRCGPEYAIPFKSPYIMIRISDFMNEFHGVCIPVCVCMHVCVRLCSKHNYAHWTYTDSMSDV